MSAAPPAGRELPPLRDRVLGKAMSGAVARVPGAWRVLRGPTKRFWEGMASHWDERANPDRPEHLAPLLAACDQLATPPTAILELGTGTGAGAVALARRFPDAEVCGVDLSEAMVEEARTKLPAELVDRVRFVAADAASLPFETAAFDLVAQLNLPIYVEETARVLRPGGYVIVASSLGPSTPYYTRERLLRRRFTRHGLGDVSTGAAATGPGTYVLARRGMGETDAVRGHYDKTASKYNRQIAFFERVLFGDGRRWVVSQATGDVLEIAAGTGRNLRHYPPDVRLTATELSPAMLDLARREAAAVGRDAELRVGDAQALDFPDESFDTVVCTLALCTIPNPAKAVAEVRRVLRPGGRFVALEHVRSPVTPVRVGQRLLDPLFVRLEHDHLLREPVEYLRSEGFEVERLERSKLGIVERVVARRPQG